MAWCLGLAPIVFSLQSRRVGANSDGEDGIKLEWNHTLLTHIIIVINTHTHNHIYIYTVYMFAHTHGTSREVRLLEHLKTSSWEYTPLSPSRRWGGIRFNWRRERERRRRKKEVEEEEEGEEIEVEIEEDEKKVELIQVKSSLFMQHILKQQ